MSGELPEVVLKESVNWTNITFKGRGLRVGQPPGEPRNDQGAPRRARRPVGDRARGLRGRVDHELLGMGRVRLELADPDEVFELLEEAWRMTATKRAIRALDEARGLVDEGPGAANRLRHRPIRGWLSP